MSSTARTETGPPPLLHTVEDAARLLSLSRSRTWELIASGELRSLKIGRARRVTADELARFVHSRASSSGGPPAA